jgi:hypothetical protein
MPSWCVRWQLYLCLYLVYSSLPLLSPVVWLLVVHYSSRRNKWHERAPYPPLFGSSTPVASGSVEFSYSCREDGWLSLPHYWRPHCSIWVFPDILVSTWWWSTQKRPETCSWFLQQFENTVVLRRTFIHLISTRLEVYWRVQRILEHFSKSGFPVFGARTPNVETKVNR